jgi:uncharacterized delta-60 repeat protein
VVKVTANGSADTGFGGGDGTRIVSVLGSGRDFTQDVVAMQGDGKIVVLASSREATVLARYLPDGELDPSFGVQGLVVSEEWPSPAAIAIQSGGRILVACSQQGTQSHMAVVGLTPAGAIDPAFGVGGVAVLPHPSGRPSSATALVTLEDGSILIAGGLQDPVTWHMNDVVVAKLHADGSSDLGFGSLGFSTVGAPGVNDLPTSIAVFPVSGAIAVAGVSGNWVGLALFHSGGASLTPFATSIGYQLSSVTVGVDIAVNATDQLYIAGGLVSEANG